MLAPVLFLSVLTFVLGDEKFDQKCLEAHNKYREKHHAPALVLDPELQTMAQTYADTIAPTKSMTHSNAKGVGENLYMSSGGDPDAAKAVKAWYDEIKDYDFKEAKFNMKTGHFTQVVWKKSEKLGCAFAKNEDGSIYVVANYKPAGNVAGQFKDNVLPSFAAKVVSSLSVVCLCSLTLTALCV